MNTELIKNSFWSTYGALASKLLALVSNLLLARLLTPAEFGVMSVAYIFWAFVNLFTQGTLGSYIVYKGAEDRKCLDTTYSISLAISLIISILMLALSPLIANFFSIPVLTWIVSIFSINFILSSLQSVYAAVLRSKMKFKELSNITLLASLFRVTSTLIAAITGLSYWSFVIGDTSYWILLTLLTYQKANHKFKISIDSNIRHEALSYSLNAAGSSLGSYLNCNSDNFTIGKVLGSVALGYYNLAYQITLALNTIINQVMDQVGMSAYAKIKELEQQKEVLVQVIEHTAFVAAPLYSLCFLLINPQFITIVFGAKWLPSCAVIPWLLILAYCRLLNGPIFSMLAAVGRPDINARVNLHIAPVAVLGFWVGAQSNGILGVSIAAAVSLGIVWTFYCTWTSSKVFGLDFIVLLKPCLKAALISVVSILISYNLPYSLKALLFIVIYTMLTRYLDKNQFRKYKSYSNHIFKCSIKKINLLWVR
jgi:lipopolysaccharide exporter